MKKTLMKLFLILFAAGILCLCVFVGIFLNSTTTHLEDYCKIASLRGASNFIIYTGSETEDLLYYKFAVSINGDSGRGQELFVFREKPFGLIKHTGRYELEYQGTSQDEQEVGSLMLEPRSPDKNKINKNILIFYSDNKAGISSAEFESVANVSGNDIEKRVSYSINASQPFLIYSTELEVGEKIEKFVFCNDSGVVYSY